MDKKNRKTIDLISSDIEDIEAGSHNEFNFVEYDFQGDNMVFTNKDNEYYKVDLYMGNIGTQVFPKQILKTLYE